MIRMLQVILKKKHKIIKKNYHNLYNNKATHEQYTVNL